MYHSTNCQLSSLQYYYYQAASQYYIDAVYCGLSLCHDCEPHKMTWPDRDAEWVVDMGGPKEPSIRWGPEPPREENFEADGAAHCKA